MNDPIPPSVRGVLWSYDTTKLDLKNEADKLRIITNILNHGTKEATDWLFAVVKREDIQRAIKHALPGEWNKKSLNFWSYLFDVIPGSAIRQIP
jgi:hypothetical protein